MTHVAQRHLPSAERGEDWSEHALCRGADVEIFFPKRKTDAHAAFAFCRACPVAEACRADVEAASRPTGVWAGDLWIDGRRIPGSEIGHRRPPQPKTEAGRRREYSIRMRGQAIALYRQSRHLYRSNTACVVAVATALGVHKQTVAKWLRMAEAGMLPPLPAAPDVELPPPAPPRPKRATDARGRFLPDQQGA